MEQLDMIFFGLSLGLKVFTIYFAVVGGGPAPEGEAPDPFCGGRRRPE